MLLINLLLLKRIVLMPFSSSLIGKYENLQHPIIVYAGHDILAGLTLLGLWCHVSKHERLAKTNLEPEAVRNKLRSLFLPTIVVASMG